MISTKWTTGRSLPSRVRVVKPAFCVVYRPQVDGAVAGSGHNLTADRRGQGVNNAQKEATSVSTALTQCSTSCAIL